MKEGLDLVNVIINSLTMVLGMLFVLELTHYTDCMKRRQKIFNWISILLLLTFVVPFNCGWIKIGLIALPFVFNTFDILNLQSKEIWYKIINWIEYLILTILLIYSILRIFFPA